MTHPFTPEMFQRMDDSEDPLFYAFPRKVVHIDDPAIAAAGQFMATTFAPHGVLLDLMSSWRSHLPAGFVKQRMVGLGLNAEEMADNPDLDMIRPLEVFADVRRILKPSAPFIVLFSNRMFPTKAVRVWQVLRDERRAELIRAYFHHAGGYDEPVFHNLSPNPGLSDPLYAVCACKGVER